MAAIGCKYGIILIFDMLSKVIVRSLSLYHNEEVARDYRDTAIYKANTDADYFSMYRSNFVYVEDDFVFNQARQAYLAAAASQNPTEP